MQTSKWVLTRLTYPGSIILSGKKEYYLGRGRDAYCSILNLYVSRKHCVFREEDGNLTVEDLGSSNGTYVNEKLIDPNVCVSLKENDRIGLGVSEVIDNDCYMYRLCKDESSREGTESNSNKEFDVLHVKKKETDIKEVEEQAEEGKSGVICVDVKMKVEDVEVSSSELDIKESIGQKVCNNVEDVISCENRISVVKKEVVDDCSLPIAQDKNVHFLHLSENSKLVKNEHKSNLKDTGAEITNICDLQVNAWQSANCDEALNLLSTSGRKEICDSTNEKEVIKKEQRKFVGDKYVKLEIVSCDDEKKSNNVCGPKTERRNVAKRCRDVLLKDEKMNSDSGSKKIKLEPMSNDVADVTASSSSVKCSSQEVNPDEWFAKFSDSFLGRTSKKSMVCKTGGKEIENESIFVSKAKPRKEEEIKCSKGHRKNTPNPIVIVDKLDLTKLKGNKLSHVSEEEYVEEKEICTDSKSIQGDVTYCNEETGNGFGVSDRSEGKINSSCFKTEDVSSETLYTSINYSQSDDVIVIDDDEDDDERYSNGEGNSEMKGEKSSGLIPKSGDDKSDGVYEKWEMFDNSGDEVEEVDSDIEIVNEWIFKLSQSSSPVVKKEIEDENEERSLPAVKKTYFICSSDSSEEEYSLSPGKEIVVNSENAEDYSFTKTSKKQMDSDRSDDESSTSSHREFPLKSTEKYIDDEILSLLCDKEETALNSSLGKEKEVKANDITVGQKDFLADANYLSEEKISNRKKIVDGFISEVRTGEMYERTDEADDNVRNEQRLKSTVFGNKAHNKHPSRKTILCSPLPVMKRSHSVPVGEREVHTNEFFSDLQKACHKNRQSKNVDVSKRKRNKCNAKNDHVSTTNISASEMKKQVKEFRKAKLKSLACQSSVSEKTKEKVGSKSSIRAKNTVLSRADKLARSLSLSIDSSSNKEKGKVGKMKEKNIAKDVSNTASSSRTVVSVEGKSMPDPESHMSKPLLENHTSSEAKYSSHVIENKVRKLSFKDLPKIPKKVSGSTSCTKLPEEPDTCSSSVNTLPMQAQKSALKSSSRHGKRVSFAPENSLCIVHSFNKEKDNAKKLLANVAEKLYDSSQCAIDRVITFILKTWNPRWIQEEKMVLQGGGDPPPVLGEECPVSRLCPLLTSYLTYDDYFKIIDPLMIVNLWTLVSEMAENEDGRRRKYDLTVNETKEINGIISANCSLSISDYENRNNLFPRVGDLCVIRYPVWNSVWEKNREKPKEKFIERFAYIESHRKDYSHKGDYSGAPDHCKVTYVIKFKCDKNVNIINPSIKVFNYIKPNLRCFEAVAFLKYSRLCKMILNPSVSDYQLPEMERNVGLETKDILNECQKEAVMKCAAMCRGGTPKIALIHGPPGTGKTKVIVNLVKQILYYNGEYSTARSDKKPRILLCAPSNTAADVLTERLLLIRSELPKEHRFKMVRVGPQEHVSESVCTVLLDTLVEKNIELSKSHQDAFDSVGLEVSTLEARKRCLIMSLNHAKGKNESTAIYEKRLYETERKIAELKMPKRNERNHVTARMKVEAKKKILRFADIVVSTLSSSFSQLMTEVFASRNGRSLARFTCCIIDEASQCQEPECLIPIMLGIERLVMVGDPEQLSATVRSQVAKLKSFNQSLFYRIWSKFQYQANNPVFFLNKQYRMHPEIMKWTNKTIYQNKIESDSSVHYNFNLRPYCFFSHSFPQSSQSVVNALEAVLVNMIAEITEDKCREFVKTIGIISPYQSQVKEIRGLLSRRSTTKRISVTVNTVDGFQGRECDVIIFSCARSRGVGFMNETQRLNVALTRARLSLIICGNFASLKEDKIWASLLHDAKLRSAVVTVSDNFKKETLAKHLFFL